VEGASNRSAFVTSHSGLKLIETIKLGRVLRIEKKESVGYQVSFKEPQSLKQIRILEMDLLLIEGGILTITISHKIFSV